MTTTYQGNNTGLEYNADTATWGLKNTTIEYIDTDAFASTDPDFVYAPPAATEEEEDNFNPCPVGYTYDTELKQCVIDPNAESNFMQTVQDSGNTQERRPVQIAGTDKFTTNNNFIASREEYAAMSASDLIENLKQRGFVERDKTSGDFVIDLTRGSIGAAFYDMGLKRFGQSSNLQLDKKKNIISLLVSKGIMDTTTAYPRGGMSATGDGSDIPNKVVIPTIGIADATRLGSAPGIVVPGFGDNVFGKLEFDNVMQKKLDAFKSTALLTSTNYNNYLKESGVGDIIGGQEAIREAQEAQEVEKRNKKAENRRKEADALSAEIKAEKESVNLARLKVENRRKENIQQDIRQAETKQQKKDEYRDTGQTTYNTKDTGGYVTTPNKPSAPPGERGGGGYSPPSKPKSGGYQSGRGR